jgi:cystathionine beta-lyase
MHKETILAKAGCTPQYHQGCVNTPVYRASTIIIPTLEDFNRAMRGEVKSYGRYGTRTNNELEKSLAILEGADHAMTFPSGLNAIWTVLGAFVSAGDHLLMVDCAYSPTRRIALEELSRFGVETTFFDPLIGAGIEALIKPNTRLIYLESPGFLTMEVVDVPAIAKVAHQHDIVVACDNTWATPLYGKPFELGVDISVHSGTKYVSGHSDILLGILTFKDKYSKQLQRYAHNVGAATSSDVCYLAQRGLHTMAVRLKQHYESALHVATWLSQHPKVESVLYPALPGDPGHALWKQYFTGACGLFSFVLKEAPSHEALARMLDNMQICVMGFSWGGFESLLIPIDPRPVRSASRWPHQGQAFRIHVGLEHVDDIIDDLKRGLERLG